MSDSDHEQEHENKYDDEDELIETQPPAAKRQKTKAQIDGCYYMCPNPYCGQVQTEVQANSRGCSAGIKNDIQGLIYNCCRRDSANFGDMLKLEPVPPEIAAAYVAKEAPKRTYQPCWDDHDDGRDDAYQASQDPHKQEILDYHIAQVFKFASPDTISEKLREIWPMHYQALMEYNADDVYFRRFYSI